MIKITGLLILSIFSNLSASAKSHYVSNTGQNGASGRLDDPWSLQKALNHPAEIHPGDTVWIRGGIYKASYDAQTAYSCKTHGLPGQPIIFRNYAHERVIIDSPLPYSLYAGLGQCSYTWFWGLEIMNSGLTDRNNNITGGITCTAENMKFINLVIHDTGTGIDAWKTAKNTEINGCIIYHIGNNLLNNGNWEGHGHGMYLQNDTFGMKEIAGNIIFNTYGYGMKVWQTTTTAPLGNFYIHHNILFNGGSASENLGGVGNNSRTHNFFIVSNSTQNPIINTKIVHNYTYSGLNMPRPPVNAFGLNYGVKNFILDSNYLNCQTRLGYNNTPVFQASVIGNKIIGGIPPVYGYYLWGFTTIDFPNNEYVPQIPDKGVEYFLIPNKYDTALTYLAIYNWELFNEIPFSPKSLGLAPGNHYEIIQIQDLQNVLQSGICEENKNIIIPMSGHQSVKVIGSQQPSCSPYPAFGVFIIRKKILKITSVTKLDKDITPLIYPNPFKARFNVEMTQGLLHAEILTSSGQKVLYKTVSDHIPFLEFDLSHLAAGIYYLKLEFYNGSTSLKKIIHIP